MFKPESGKQYAITGKSGAKCLSNGNTWEESVVKTKCEQCGDETDLLTNFTKYQVCGKCTRKNHKSLTK